MIRFRIKLADIPMQIDALYHSTLDFCRDYLTEEIPAFEIIITQADIEKERRLSALTDIREGRKEIYYPDEYLETLALYRRISDKLIDYQVILFHGSVVALNGKAYLFTAKSGTGKTTHTKLWLKNIPESYVLNGDKPLLRFKENGVYACGTPWQGKENYGTNEILPLAAICILERDTSNHIERICFKNVMDVLVTQSYHANGSRIMDSLKLIGRLEKLKLYRLGCNMEDEAAFVSYRGMVEDDQ